MAAKRARKRTRSQPAFKSSSIISELDLDLTIDDISVEDKRRPRQDSNSSSGKRTINGETADLSGGQISEVTISMYGLALIARKLEVRLARNPHDGGRRRECKVLDVLLVSIMSWTFGSTRAACRHFKDKRNWRRCRAALRRAYPGLDEDLSKRAPSRGQVSRLLKRISEEPELELVRDAVQQMAVTAAQFIGIFDQAAKFSSPSKQSCITGDGTDLKKLRGDKHFECVLVSARNEHPGERVVLGSDVLAPPRTKERKAEATTATDMVLKIKKTLDSQSGGLFGFVYDMALHSADFDRCLSAGIIAISKVQRTSAGQYAALNIGKCKFRLADGTRHPMPVIAIDGAPTIAIAEASGTTYYAKLDRIKTVRKERANDIVIWGHWAVPSIQGVPAKLWGAIVLLQHNSTKDDIAKGKPRTRALRPIPESDPYFDEIFGLRPDIESTNNHMKSRLPGRRAKHLDTNRVKLDLIMYQLHTIVTALINYHKRTSADLSGWIGKHKIDL
ncbi:hypothetical protein [Candidatus Poriferisodalis sp.]|uniref:hypothetical protein n=1 Tax=Candidatus Poriferisodalis sp. TaxID=3101277 RepID=UPI003B522010